jgi:serine/threonine-protein kinase
LTVTGTVLGTLGYMSPEQLRGQTPTATSDIFSLGCVLYEVLNGQRPFDRLTPADTMAAVLHDDPSFDDSGASWPPPLIAVTRRCLAKDGADRFQSGRDLAAALRTAVTAPAAEQQADSIAVLPFANGGGADAEHLGDGLAESLINALARIPGLRVVPRSTVFRYKGHPDPHALARELEVRLLLSGKVLQRDDRLLVQAELVDAVARQQLWGERFSRTSADIFSVEQEIASQIVEQLRVKLSRQERKQISERATEDAQAYDLYLKARYHWSKRTPESIRHAIEYFETAIERDPMFARAWAGLAETRILFGWYGLGIIRELFDSAIAAARMAVKLNPDLGEAHAALGFGLCCTGQWDNGLRECEQAIQLSPGYFLAHDWYAIVLSSLGRFDEAAAAIATARRLEPLSLVVHHHDAWVSVMAGRFHDARQAASQALELDAGYSFGWWWLGITQTELGFTEDAVRSLERAAQIFGDFGLGHSALGHAYGRDGRREEALRCLTVLSRSDPQRTDPYHQALVHVGIGELEIALEELTDAFAANSTWLRIYGPHDPRLNPLRGDRRLIQLFDAPASTIRDIS